MATYRKQDGEPIHIGCGVINSANRKNLNEKSHGNPVLSNVMWKILIRKEVILWKNLLKILMNIR